MFSLFKPLTHVAGICASNGVLSDGIFSGIAPESHILSLKILDEAGHGTSSWALDAIKWIHINKIKYNIRVVNMSIGTNDSAISSTLLNAVRGLYSAGITVVAAAGNESRRRISSPGVSPFVITVGAMEENVRFRLRMNRATYFKPDVFAPSENIISCRSETFSFDSGGRSSEMIVNDNYIAMSGTSMATPMVSGTAALLYQYNPSLTPLNVKKIITSACSKEGHLLNIEKIF